MNLSDLFSPFLEQLLYKPIQKIGLWGARQSLGAANGNAAEPAVDAVAGIVAGSAAQTLTAHLNNDKLAGQVGLPTTEQALTQAAAQVISGQSTLDLTSQSLLAGFLSQNIVKQN